MDDSNPSHNNYTESNNLQSTAAIIQPNIVASNSDFSNNMFPTTSQTNNNYSVHQSTFNENIPISRSYPPIDLQQSTADVIQPEHDNVINVDFSMMNDNSISPTSHTNNNNFNQQHTSNVQSYSPSTTSSYAQQYGHPSSSQPIGNTFPPFNTTTINTQPEIFSFDIPGFKIIIVPSFSQRDNTFSNYSSSDITDNQFTQFTQ
ncbi:22796_t:CDS:1 [Rhizophagus irregularis]|nr:22796_t:CDS:1 [Rhizophagus irregularis]